MSYPDWDDRAGWIIVAVLIVLAAVLIHIAAGNDWRST